MVKQQSINQRLTKKEMLKGCNDLKTKHVIASYS